MFTPRQYQTEAIEFLRERLLDRRGAGLFLDPGLGKTAITLSIISELQEQEALGRVLVVAPRRVIHHVWPAEIYKWDFPVSFRLIHGGSALARERMLLDKADIHLITPDLLPWLVTAVNFQLASYDLMVLDESTKFKNFTAKRSRAAQKLRKAFKSAVILTGTPSPNGLDDLFGQMAILDGGRSLGKSLTEFRSRFCEAQLKRITGGRMLQTWKVKENQKPNIYEAISSSVLRLDAKDHLDMPPLITNDLWVNLPTDARDTYQELEKSLFSAIDTGENIIAKGAGSLYSKCKQIANGGVYFEDDFGNRDDKFMHNEKLDALDEILSEVGGKPVLVAFLYGHDLKRLLYRYPETPVIAGGSKDSETAAILAKWTAGKLPLLFVQPQAASHGLNMQGTCNNVVWIGLTDSLETYDQFNARVYRQGVVGGVRIHRILAEDTVEEAVRVRIDSKSDEQNALLDALKNYKKNKTEN